LNRESEIEQDINMAHKRKGHRSGAGNGNRRAGESKQTDQYNHGEMTQSDRCNDDRENPNTEEFEDRGIEQQAHRDQHGDYKTKIVEPTINEESGYTQILDSRGKHVDIHAKEDLHSQEVDQVHNQRHVSLEHTGREATTSLSKSSRAQQVRLTWEEWGLQMQAEVERLRVGIEKRDREIIRLTETLNKLQEAGLQWVDRFSPKFDSAVKSEYAIMSNVIDFIARSILSKAKTTLSDEEWTAKVLEISWKESFNENKAMLTPLNRLLRRQLLSSMIWKFLQDSLFCSPFLWFGGEQGKEVTSVWEILFPTPCKRPILSSI
jgi:hypothetical protein